MRKSVNDSYWDICLHIVAGKVYGRGLTKRLTYMTEMVAEEEGLISATTDEQ